MIRLGDNVNSKAIGAMLILGSILLMGPWILLGVDTSDMSPSKHLTAILAKSTETEITAILNVFGVMSMFTGLYFLARSLKSDNSVSNTFAEIAGLFVLLSVPVWVILVGSDISAIEMAKEHGNEHGATIVAASTAFQTGALVMVVGLVLLGISLTLLKKYKRSIGILFVIAPVLAIIDSIGLLGNEIVQMLGWMGMFLTIFVTGILTTLQKENQT